LGNSSELLAKIRKMEARQKALRRAKWEQIKKEWPEGAEFLQSMSKTFGKPESVTITIGDRKLL